MNRPESRSERFALAIDLGSGALKVGAVSLAGEIAAVAQRDYETERLPGGGAIQDASAWWEMVRELAGSALKGIPADRVVAVSCTGQWASTIPVDEAGEPVGPCVMWLDTRGARHSREVIGGPLMGYSPRALATWIRHTGGVPSPFGGDPVSHMLHLERDEPEVAAAARWYLEPVDYLTMRFTGRAAATHASMSGAWLTDNRRLDRLEYDPVLVGKLGLDAAKLPPLVETGSLIGAVRPEVAAELGISPSAQVVTGTPDLHSAALGCGAIGEGEPHITISTTSWISLPFPRKKTDALHSIATVPGLDSSSYLVANNHEAAGLCLRWLRESFTVDEPAGYERLIELAESSPPGSGGILFTPWIAGERSPVDDRHARGGWHNLSVRDAERRPDPLRARGRRLQQPLAQRGRRAASPSDGSTRSASSAAARSPTSGARSTPTSWTGGSSGSPSRCTPTCVAPPCSPRSRSARSHATRSATLVPVDRVFEPNQANRATYDRLYKEFPGLYKAQRKMFARLNG